MHTSQSSPHTLNSLLAQYYNIQALAVAPYHYTENGTCNATGTSDPPLLAVHIETMKTQFDVNCTSIDLSTDNKTSELWGWGGGRERVREIEGILWKGMY